MKAMRDTVRESCQNRLAVVTGATKGIGLAIVKLLLQRGCNVIGAYGHDHAAAEDAQKQLGSLAGNLTLVKTDLSQIEGIDPLVAAVDAANRRLCYLILNVGVTDKTPFGEVDPKKWDHVLRANLTVPFFLTQRFAEKLPDHEGRVIFIGAVMGIWPHPLSFSYGVSKAALHFLARCLVKTLSPRGVTVNVVAPGFVETAMQQGKARDHRLRVEGKIAMGRFARADEVATAALGFIDNGYVTGQILCVDGGYDSE